MPNTLDTIPKRFRAIVEKYPQENAVLEKDAEGNFQPITYQAIYERIKIFGTGLNALGIKRGEHVGIISDNRSEWLITDMSLLGLGAVDVPRGSDSMADEIKYILKHADCKVTFAENKDQVAKILSVEDEFTLLAKIVVFDDSNVKSLKSKSNKIEVLSFKDVYELGEKKIHDKPELFEGEMEKGKIDDLATIIYTSGTTGEPKGVMLTHRSYIFQLDRVYDYIHVKAGDVFLSVLPVWHSFERAVDYVVLDAAATIAYSKPVGKIMLEDMEKVRPHWMASVPRIWEGIRAAVYRNINKEGGLKKVLFYFFVGLGEAHAYLWTMFNGCLPRFTRRIRAVDMGLSVIPLILLTPFKVLGNLLVFSKLKARLGGRFIAGISGGGALPAHVDRFFQAAGILLLEGYGLTETGPILAVRKQKAPVTGTVGPLFPDVEYRVLDREMGVLPPGHKGVLYVKSDQVMKGYYKRPEATTEVLKEGWLDTGDITIFTHNREFKIIGRAKDTIVLLGGENVEPTPIEDKLLLSEYIDQVMIVGQDQKFLAALIVANREKLEEFADTKAISYMDHEELLTHPMINELISNEIQQAINSKTGFKSFEHIFRFKLLSKPFEAGNEMTHSLKIKRNVVSELYKKEIRELFK
ncbi:MAG: AMP-binding protein [Spirochaetota bacterium]